jgi:beta-ureidopropionase / N-carbamoyl-L-amino-acid hydrolase
MAALREDSLAAAAAVDERRLCDRLDAMARIGAIPGQGVNRPALSPQDIEARALLLSWARELGLAASVDSIGNLFLRREGLDPSADPVMTGSHMDSQPKGGRFDGIYGVLAGLEALEAMAAAGVRTRAPVEVVAWTNEEGGRFPPCTMGSMVFAGARTVEDFADVRDNAGIRLGDALAQTLAATPDAMRRPSGGRVGAYVEAHIEQGPVLESAALQIGAVTGIQGMRWFNVEVSGESAHAGTAPVSLRRDALRQAVAMIGALRELTADPADVTRFTVGRMLVTPNSPNSVPSHVLFSVDIRHPDAAAIARLGEAVEPTCRALAGTCEVTVTPTLHDDPTAFDPAIVTLVEAASGAVGLPSMRLPSGASHDAMYMNRLCPTGMIFVPCERGISHNEAENAKPADLAAGARVLAATLAELANR